VIEFRDRRAAELGERLVVRSVEDSIRRGTVRLRGELDSRNAAQSVTLLEAVDELRFDALIGGARRDEEKARAKERVFSFRDAFGQWEPKQQRPECWDLYNAHLAPGEHLRVFPISNWTELDVWQYIERERLALPSLYFSHRREVVRRNGLLVPVTPLTPAKAATGSRPQRCAFAPSATSPAPARSASEAATVDEIIVETAGADVTERGATRHGRPDERRVDGAAQARGLFLDMTARTPRRRLEDHGVLRFITAGSVDDGKSTLIGRLLYDSRGILKDQLAALAAPPSAAPARASSPAATKARRRSTSRSSPTGSRPSASRASRSTSRTATSRPRSASSSSPTRPATSSTRATW
jgi:sulfate adenylyltransferase small subunit